MAQNVDCDLLVRQFSEVPKASMRVQVWAPRNNFMHACTIHKENREKSMLRVSTVCTVPCVVCCAVYKHLGPLLHCAGQVARPDCLQCHLMVVCFDGTFSLLLLIIAASNRFGQMPRTKTEPAPVTSQSCGTRTTLVYTPGSSSHECSG